MKKSTAAILVGCLVALVVYVSILSVALVRDLHSTSRSIEAYSSEGNDSNTAAEPKLEVATTTTKNDGRPQVVRAAKRHRAKQSGHRARVKPHQDNVTLLL